MLAPLVKFHSNGDDNIDKLSHSHLECPFCGKQFNVWHCGIERLKQVFGKNFELYL